MKKKLLSILLTFCMVLTLLPTVAFAEESAAVTSAQALTSVNITFPAPEAGKRVGNGSAAVSADENSGLTPYLFGPVLWQKNGSHQKLDADNVYTEGSTYLLQFSFYTKKPITSETVITFNGQPVTLYTEYNAFETAVSAYDGVSSTNLAFVMFSEDGIGDPSMAEVKNVYIVGLYAFVRIPKTLTVEEVSTADHLGIAIAGTKDVVKLTGDITISESLTVGRTVTLDLNDHVLNMTGNDSVIKVEGGGNLTLTDSAETKSKKKFAKNENSLWVLDANGNQSVTGGVITGGKGFRSGNYAYGGVYVAQNGTFTMNGGNIVGCTAFNDQHSMGGGVYVAPNGTFTMTGGNITGCTAVGGYSYGGGVYTEGTTTLSGTAEIRDCYAKDKDGDPAYGGGVHAADGVFKIRDNVKITGCSTAVGDTTDAMYIGNGGVISGGMFDGSVENEGTISGGIFNGPVKNRRSITGGTFNGGVTNGGNGTISGATVIASVSTEADFLAALADKNVTTIKIMDEITVEATESVKELRIDRAVTLVNSSRKSVQIHCPLTIDKDGALTLDDRTCVYPLSSVTVNGSLTVGENSEIIFEVADTSLKVSQGATVTTQPAGNDTIAGLLSLGKGVTLTVEGTLENNGTLSVSDMENLKKAAAIGGDLALLGMTITEDYTLDMKGKLLSIRDFLNFSNANLTVRNASRVDATGTIDTLSGGSYYCPVYARYSEDGITGGSFYGPVTVRCQDGSEGTVPTPISGGMFYGELKGASAETDYSIQGNTVTFMDDGSKYAMQVVASNGKATAPDTPVKSGYTFAGWYTEAGEMFDFENTNVTENITLTAKWTRNSSSRTYYTIQATAGTGGAISPSGKVSVREGREQVFTITPDQGYAVSDVKIDGESVGAVTSYSFENVRKAHTIAVSFAKVKAFVDVPAGSYYEDAVNWAVENGITQGTDDTHFSPDDVCTRAQMVTFLWRAAGSPKVENGKNPFTDVKADAYYYDAVLWAVEKGVTSGTSATTFSPDATVTRGQTVTFLYRNAGSPEVSGTMPFTDVEADAYYAKAVQWAVQQKITTGTSETTFSPMSDCTRGQIVTFLYRAK